MGKKQKTRSGSGSPKVRSSSSAGKQLLFSVRSGDLKWETFRSGGPGGQHQNTSDTGVRVRHAASGAVGEARDTRSQYQNRRAALERLARSGKFLRWVNLRAIGEEDLDRVVARWMEPENIRVEARQPDGTWKAIG